MFSLPDSAVSVHVLPISRKILAVDISSFLLSFLCVFCSYIKEISQLINVHKCSYRFWSSFKVSIERMILLCRKYLNHKGSLVGAWLHFSNKDTYFKAPHFLNAWAGSKHLFLIFLCEDTCVPIYKRYIFYCIVYSPYRSFTIFIYSILVGIHTNLFSLNLIWHFALPQRWWAVYILDAVFCFKKKKTAKSANCVWSPVPLNLTLQGMGNDL